MKNILMIAIVALGLGGCASNGLTIAKCDKYENGNCINAQTIQMVECKNPLIQDDKTFCEK